MRPPADPTGLPRQDARPEGPVARITTEPGQHTPWRPPVRLVGWLELLRRIQPSPA